MFIFRLVRIRFFSPIIFQRSYIGLPWRVPSDYLIRALTYAYSKLYDAGEWFSFLKQDILRVSSLILIYRDNLYFPEYGVKGYVSLDGDVVGSSNLVDTVSRVRTPRIEGIEPTPFEDYQLLTPRYDWAVILGIRENHYEKAFHKVMASLRLLGDIGLGARKTRGSGRFKVIQDDNPKSYGARVEVSGLGKLISRYINSKRDFRKDRTTRRVYIERTKIYYGGERFREYYVVAEGSEIDVADSGLLEYFKNDLSHNVPLYYRPLIIAI